MKKIALIAATVLIAFTSGHAQKKNSVKQKETPVKGYAIDMKLTDAAAGKMVVFNRYVESTSHVVDSLPINSENHVRFMGEERLTPGMYNLSVAMPGGQNQSIDFFISIGAPQQFSLEFDLAKGLQSLVVKGSPENEVFAECMHNISKIQQRGQALQQRMQEAVNPDSAAAIGAQLQALNSEIKAQWATLNTRVPGSTLALFIKSIQEPEAPAPNISPLVPNRDSAMQAYYMNYYREHFFDNVDFSDARILNMPVLLNSLNLYTMRVLPLDKNILMERYDFIINKAKANRQVYEWVVRNRYDFFRTAPYPELEEVATHIAEQYVVEDSLHWADKAYVARMADVVRLARLNPVGSKATNLKLEDPAGNHIAIDDIQARYIVLSFYNPKCGTCAIVTPMLWETYQKYNKKGLQVFAIYVDQNRNDWVPYVTTEHNYTWLNGWDPTGDEKLYEKYDIHAIPTIYLLDRNKTIILKNVTIEQLNEKLSELLGK